MVILGLYSQIYYAYSEKGNGPVEMHADVLLPRGHRRTREFVGSCLATKVFIDKLPAIYGMGVGDHRVAQ